MNEDPERLVAEALRAHAARTPVPEPDTSNETTSVLGGGYGLLSGSDLRVPLARLDPEEDEATIIRGTGTEATVRIEPDRRVHAGLIILLAVVLGLAAGAVVGLLTLI